MEVITFTCSICSDASRDICVYCTKDACANHLCDRCHRCSDCCNCEMPVFTQPNGHKAVTMEPAPLENDSIPRAE